MNNIIVNKKIKLNVSIREAVEAIINEMLDRGIINKAISDDGKYIMRGYHSVDWRDNTDIKKARILVSGGRGIGSADYYDELQKLADILGAEVSSSRANVVAGWIDKSRQVGNTGNTVAPELYLACGISGTNQHIAGMSGAQCIIAINSNSTAPIFNIADLGIVGDLKVIIPKLINALKKYNGK